MTTVVVHSGACGFTTTIRAEKTANGKLTLSLESQCEMVLRMLADISVVDRFTPLTGFAGNPVYLSAAKHLKHVSCPVPSGILKALEVAAGLNVPREATITFLPDP
jgi:hypothetical protein